MFPLERASHDKPVGWRSLLGILIVPIIVALGFLGATWHADSRLHRAEAAVVNLDEMVELNGQPVPLGRQLAAGLVERRDDNLTWTLADAPHAAAGLKSGRYVAVITIPKDFSADATSFSGPASAARQATIRVETSEITGIADGAIAQVIAETARNVFNTELTETYLDNIYLGFNETQKQFRTVADGAGQLADGGGQLADGLRASADGAEELGTGSREYATGVAQAATGADQLATGAEQLAAGGGQLREGADGLAGGAGQLGDGLQTMADQTRDLPAQTRMLADGAGQAADGVDQLATGMSAMADGVGQLADGSQALADGAGQLAPGVRAYVDGVDQLVAGMEPVIGLLDSVDASALDQARLQQAADQLGVLQGQAQAYANQLEAFANTPCPTPAGVEFTPEQQTAFCAAWAQAMAGLTAPDPRTGKSPVQWTQEIASSGEFAQAITTVQTTLPQLPEIIEGAGQIRELRPAGQQIVSGVDQLATGAGQLNDGVQALNSGIAEGADQLPLLSDGMRQLADGAGQLADGMVPLSAGIQSAATGAGELSDGAGQFAAGVGTYVDGVGGVAGGTRSLATGLSGMASGADELATGTEGLADGLDQAAVGAREVADGQRTLADGLADGASQIPTYSAADRDALKTVVANPVAAGTAPNLIPAAASTSLLMVLALWLGGLATYLVIRAVSSRVLTSTRSSMELVRRAVVPGLAIAAVQAVALTVLGQIVLGLSGAKTLGVLAMLLLGGAMFVLVNHALVAWFGGVGRIISVALVTLAAAGGILSALPALFDVVIPALPLTPVLNGVRAIITDGTGVTGAVGMTLLWLLIGLAASVGAVVRKRTASPERFARELPVVA
ncbi:YhgE/Pip family protein [Granulicoccus sp. GXG6511]|uniref:YhgE/Pip family protein n=1 Tax=Granulicoccus sp. GXG6511 TaxID=3381351 RepID=UPI003D7F087B